MNITFFRWLITSLSLGMAVARIFFPALTIDAITIMLFGMAFVPWVGRIFGTLEFPGVKVTTLREAGDRIEDSGLIAQERATKVPAAERHVYAFETIPSRDANMVLAGLRIELERWLREVATANGIGAERTALRKVVRELTRQNIIRGEEAGAIADLLPLLNRAVHGAKVDRASAEWALSFGPHLLDALRGKGS